MLDLAQDTPASSAFLREHLMFHIAFSSNFSLTRCYDGQGMNSMMRLGQEEMVNWWRRCRVSFVVAVAVAHLTSAPNKASSRNPRCFPHKFTNAVSSLRCSRPWIVASLAVRTMDW